MAALQEEVRGDASSGRSIERPANPATPAAVRPRYGRPKAPARPAAAASGSSQQLSVLELLRAAMGGGAAGQGLGQAAAQLHIQQQQLLQQQLQQQQLGGYGWAAGGMGAAQAPFRGVVIQGQAAGQVPGAQGSVFLQAAVPLMVQPMAVAPMGLLGPAMGAGASNGLYAAGMLGGGAPAGASMGLQQHQQRLQALLQQLGPEPPGLQPAPEQLPAPSHALPDVAVAAAAGDNQNFTHAMLRWLRAQQAAQQEQQLAVWQQLVRQRHQHQHQQQQAAERPQHPLETLIATQAGLVAGSQPAAWQQLMYQQQQAGMYL